MSFLSPLRLERKPKDLDLLTLVSSKTVLANVVLKDSNVVDPKLNANNVVEISIVPKHKYAGTSTSFFAIHVLLTSDAKTQRKEF